MIGTVKIAALLGVSEVYARKLCQNGKIAAVKIGTGARATWVATVADVEAFAVEHRPVGRPPRNT